MGSARVAWGRRYGWSLFALLGAVLVGIGLWALTADRPAMSAIPTGYGVGALAVAAWLFITRTR